MYQAAKQLIRFPDSVNLFQRKLTPDTEFFDTFYWQQLEIKYAINKQ